MNKGKVFKYELKRLLFSKEYLLLLAATLVFSASLIRGVVLFGVNFTAPFSQLTFSTYCSSLAPFYFALLLVLCAKQNKVSERGAEAIISTTSMPFHVFRLIRYSAIMCAFLATVTLPFVACFMFYRLTFSFTDIGGLLGLGVLFIIPSSLFLLGVAMFLGNRKAVGIYILLVVILFFSIFQIAPPSFLDLIGSTAVQAFYMGENTLSSVFVTGRAALLVLGIVLIIASLTPLKKHDV